MTRIKLCGLSRELDIIAANELLPEYIGFVFGHKSKRYIAVLIGETLMRAKDKKAKLAVLRGTL